MATAKKDTSLEDAADQDAYAYLLEVLRSYDLESLGPWAWEQIVEGKSEAQILQLLRETPEFERRFKAILERERLGLPPISPAEVIAWENQATQLLRAAGLPRGFYDSPDDFVKWIGLDVSIAELSQRVNDIYVRVQQADQVLRDTFAEYFGVSGDAALAAFILDPDRALPLLLTYADAAAFGGAGSRFGFDIAKPTAIQAAQLGISGTAAQQGFETLADLRPLFQETLGEARDLVAENEGVEAVFGTGGGSAAASRTAIERRQAGRLAKFRGGGGADIGNEGAVGLGASD